MIWFWRSWREDVPDAVERLRGVVGVQRREHEVTGLGERQRELDRLRVTHLADEDDVGVLTERGAQRAVERVGVEADLALVHDADLVLVHVLDRVLDGEDVDRAPLVDVVDHRRERRRLPGAGRAGDEHEALRQVAEVLAAPRQEQRVEGRDLERDRPQRQRHDALLDEAVATEAVRVVVAEGEVDFLLRVQLRVQVLRQELADLLLELGRREHGLAVDRAEVAVDAHARLRVRRQHEVGRAGGRHRPQVVLDGSDVDG